MNAVAEPLCTNGYCDRTAVAAVHLHYGHGRVLPTVLIRPDHLDKPDLCVADWRCHDCLHDVIDEALGLPSGAPSREGEKP